MAYFYFSDFAQLILQRRAEFSCDRWQPLGLRNSFTALSVHSLLNIAELLHHSLSVPSSTLISTSKCKEKFLNNKKLLCLILVSLKLAIEMPTKSRLKANVWTNIYMAIKWNIVLSRKPKEGVLVPLGWEIDAPCLKVFLFDFFVLWLLNWHIPLLLLFLLITSHSCLSLCLLKNRSNSTSFNMTGILLSTRVVSECFM